MVGIPRCYGDGLGCSAGGPVGPSSSGWITVRGAAGGGVGGCAGGFCEPSSFGGCSDLMLLVSSTHIDLRLLIGSSEPDLDIMCPQRIPQIEFVCRPAIFHCYQEPSAR